MKILISSDLHLEFENFTFTSSGIDVAVLAGDIHLGSRGIEWICKVFPDLPVIYVLGNHEYYGDIYPKLVRSLKQQTQNTRISVLENEFIKIKNITFFGCTLWTDFALFGNPRLDGFACQQIMTDYKRIRREPNYSKIRSIDVSLIHKRSVYWLTEAYKTNKSENNIIITHHAPSIRSIPPGQRGNQISAAYASPLDALVKSLAPNYWVHGHIHKHCDYQIGKTRVICHPKGYPDESKEPYENLVITV